MVKAPGGGRRTAADNTIFIAATAGKHRGNRVAQPVLEGDIAGQVTIFEDGADDVTIMIHHNVAEVGRDIREGVFLCLALAITPDQVRYCCRLLAILQAIH